MKHLTVRNLPPNVAKALEREKRRRGESLNQTVIGLMSKGLGVGAPRSNGLANLSGNWSKEDLEEFERAVAPFAEIDDELWR